MTRILGISGSLRKDSFNTRLLQTAVTLLPDGVAMDVVRLEGVPLYNADDEAAEGVPPAVVALKDRAAAADALLIATPEYNNAVPGVLKNGLDWMSRPPADIGKVFRGKPVAILGATPGGMGTVLGQASLLPTLRTLGLLLYSGGLMYVSGASRVFDEQGLSDPDLRERLRGFLLGFVEFTVTR